MTYRTHQFTLRPKSSPEDIHVLQKGRPYALEIKRIQEKIQHIQHNIRYGTPPAAGCAWRATLLGLHRAPVACPSWGSPTFRASS
ncbi:hypothetical protein C2E23DRAFT_561669 [Lenzites betulinus]|nr:hypothetical protein C2E23DRAFT_561669 [Lenzites betulinus]